ncbi:MAG: hypothetical protein KDI90_02805 [Alphaproteobacteria bacterium]|nr:hypothetical protein [Alphaproteobacteria bacterium]
MKIPADIKAKNMDEAQAMSLTAAQIRHNVEHGKDRGFEQKKASLIIADDLDDAANSYLILNEIPARGVGGEFVQITENKPPVTCPPREQISRVNTDASLDRLGLASKNGVLSMALDTAEAIGASNAAEQMLAHQMAVAHRTSLDLIAEAGNTRDPIERCRLINTASKLMDLCQKGLTTIHKIRTGGQQTVTVQHVQVSDGGQAVINSSVNDRGRGADKK